MTDTAPGAAPAAPPAGAAPAVLPDLPPPPPKPDEAPKRPTTRAGRKAAAEAAKARKAGAGKADTSPKSTAPKPRKASLETRLTESLVTLGVVIAATGGASGSPIHHDGVLITEHAASVAKALADVAKSNPAVAAALERMLTVGTWSGLIAALLPLALGIAANHGAVPPYLVAALGGMRPEAPAAAAPAGAVPGMP